MSQANRQANGKCPRRGKCSRRLSRLLLSSILATTLAGCTAAHYRRSADNQAYRLISEKAGFVTNMEPHFTIEQTNSIQIRGPVEAGATNEFLGQAAAAERGAQVLSLEEALYLGVKHSRIYQNSREQLYLSALSLALARHQFTPIFSARGSGAYLVRTEETVSFEPDPVTGEPRPVLSDQLAERSSVQANGSVGVDWLIRDIGRISAAFTTDFLRFLSGDPRTLVSSEVGATFTRPILRNAGFKAEVESLTQSERDLLYAVRDFVRFRKTFSVQIASAYYGVLGARDSARNTYLNLEGSKRSGERTRALAAEGKATQTDLGRIETQELQAESSWIAAVRAYQRALDDFKIQLGIPVATKVVLADQELRDLRIRQPDINVEDAIRIALAARLDYQNIIDQQADSHRKVLLAADRLKPQLDFVARGGLTSPQQTHGFPLPEVERYNWSAGANLDLPLERKSEQVAYRGALIAEERSARNLGQRRDEIELQVRESWRTLEQARRTYQISEIGVKLAERRVEEQDLLAELGKARALDQVDAQNALLTSMDARTQALVAHTIARLQFWDNMGILYIKENGTWQEGASEEVPQPRTDLK